VPNQLSDREVRWLQRLHRRQPFAIAVAFVLIAAGGGYSVWALQRFKLGASQSAHPDFDVPIARVQRLFEQLIAAPQVEAATQLEQRLIKDRQDLGRFASGLLVLILRVSLGSMALVQGLILLSVALAQKPLLKVIDKLRSQTR